VIILILVVEIRALNLMNCLGMLICW